MLHLMTLAVNFRAIAMVKTQLKKVNMAFESLVPGGNSRICESRDRDWLYLRVIMTKKKRYVG